MDASEGTPELPPKLAETYEVGGLLGAGAFGRVYQATRRFDSAKVAIKVLSQEILDDPRLADRFRREGRLGTQLASAHLVRTLDGGVADGYPYLVMEWIDGPTLETVMEGAQQGLDRVWVEARVRELMAGLEVMHDAGAVHRDIKPANVLLRGGEQAVLADLGLARATGELTLTRTGEILGSPAYMAPEQMRGEVKGAASVDIYGLGVLAYELLTGRLPFDQDNLGELLAAKQAGLRTSLRSERVEASPELEQLMREWLDPDPARRPADIRALGRAWTEALAAPAKPLSGIQAMPEAAPVVPDSSALTSLEATTAVLGQRPLPPAASEPPREAPAPGGGYARRAMVTGATVLLVSFGFFRGEEPPPAPAPTTRPLAQVLDELVAAVPEDPAVARFLELASGADDADRHRADATKAVAAAMRQDSVSRALAGLVGEDPPPREETSRLNDVLLTSRLVLRWAHRYGVAEDREDAVDDLGRAFARWVRAQDVPELSMRYQITPGVGARRRVEAAQAAAAMARWGGRWVGQIDPGARPGAATGWSLLPCGEGQESARLLRSTWGKGTRFQRLGDTGTFQVFSGTDPCEMEETPTRRRFPLAPVAGDLVLLVRAYGYDPTVQVELTLVGDEERVRLPLPLPLVAPYPEPDERDRRRQGFLVRVHRALVPPGLRRGELAAYAVRAFSTLAPSISVVALYQQVEGDAPPGLGDAPGERAGAAVRALRDRLLLEKSIATLRTTRLDDEPEDVIEAWRAARGTFVEELVASGLDAPEIEAFPGPLDLPSLRAAGQVLSLKRLLEWRSKAPPEVDYHWAQNCMRRPLPGGASGSGPLLDGLERLVRASLVGREARGLNLHAHRHRVELFRDVLEQGGRSWRQLDATPAPAISEGPLGSCGDLDFRLRARFPDGRPWRDSIPSMTQGGALGELLQDQAPGTIQRSIHDDACSPEALRFEPEALGHGEPLRLAVVLNDWPDGLQMRLGLRGADVTYELPLEVPSAGRSMAGTMAQGLVVRVDPEALPPELQAFHLRAVGLQQLVRDKPTVGVGLVFQQLAGPPMSELAMAAEADTSGALPPPRDGPRQLLRDVHAAVMTDSDIQLGLASATWQDSPRVDRELWLASRAEFQQELVRRELGPALAQLEGEPLGIPDVNRLGELALIHRLFSIHQVGAWKQDPERVGDSLPWGRTPDGRALEGVGAAASPGVEELLARWVRSGGFAPLQGLLPADGGFLRWAQETRPVMAARGTFESRVPYKNSPLLDYRSFVGNPHPTYATVQRVRRQSFPGVPYPFAVKEGAATLLVSSLADGRHRIEERYSPGSFPIPLPARPRPEGLTLVFSCHSWRTEVGWLELEGAAGTHRLRVPFTVPQAPPLGGPGRSKSDAPRAGVGIWVHPDLLPEGLHQARLRAYGHRAVGHTSSDAGLDEVYEMTSGAPLFPEPEPAP